MAVVRLRHDTEGRAYHRRKLAASKTPMEAMHLLDCAPAEPCWPAEPNGKVGLPGTFMTTTSRSSCTGSIRHNESPWRSASPRLGHTPISPNHPRRATFAALLLAAGLAVLAVAVLVAPLQSGPVGVAMFVASAPSRLCSVSRSPAVGAAMPSAKSRRSHRSWHGRQRTTARILHALGRSLAYACEEFRRQES